jgi:hypothetical protein
VAAGATAIVCASDSLALGAAAQLREASPDRPAAVTGFDDTPVAAAVGLSSVASKARTLSRSRTSPYLPVPLNTHLCGPNTIKRQARGKIVRSGTTQLPACPAAIRLPRCIAPLCHRGRGSLHSLTAAQRPTHSPPDLAYIIRPTFDEVAIAPPKSNMQALAPRRPAVALGACCFPFSLLFILFFGFRYSGLSELPFVGARLQREISSRPT